MTILILEGTIEIVKMRMKDLVAIAEKRNPRFEVKKKTMRIWIGTYSKLNGRTIERQMRGERERHSLYMQEDKNSVLHYTYSKER